MNIAIAGMTRAEIDEEFTKKEISAFLKANGFELPKKYSKDEVITMLYQYFEIDEEANADLPDPSEIEESDEDVESDEEEGEEDEEGTEEGTDSDSKRDSSMVFLSPEEATTRINAKRIADIERMKEAQCPTPDPEANDS